MKRKLILNCVLIALPILAIWTSVHIRELIAELLRYMFSRDLVIWIQRSFLYYVPHFFFALFTGFLFWKFKVKLRLLLLLIPTLIISSLIRGWYIFYYYQAMPPSDLQKNSSMPDCLFENNYPDYWTYINEGCHFTLEDLIKGLINISTLWLIVILLMRLLIEIRLQRKQIAKNPDVLD